jgi:hypothetical protein
VAGLYCFRFASEQYLVFDALQALVELRESEAMKKPITRYEMVGRHSDRSNLQGLSDLSFKAKAATHRPTAKSAGVHYRTNSTRISKRLIGTSR